MKDRIYTKKTQLTLSQKEDFFFDFPEICNEKNRLFRKFLLLQFLN